MSLDLESRGRKRLAYECRKVESGRPALSGLEKRLEGIFSRPSENAKRLGAVVDLNRAGDADRSLLKLLGLHRSDSSTLCPSCRLELRAFRVGLRDVVVDASSSLVDMCDPSKSRALWCRISMIETKVGSWQE